jgi:hypothetical protein
MKYYHYLRYNLKTSKKEPEFRDIAVLVTDKLEQIWKMASIPFVSRDRTMKMLSDYHKKNEKHD